MSRFRRRRSWVSTKAGNEGVRLSTMVVLLIVVLLLMLIANRPAIWSRFVPYLDPPASANSAESAKTPAKGDKTTAPQPHEAAGKPHSIDGQSPLLLGGLIVVGLAYFGWRMARIARAVSRHAQSKEKRNAPSG